jgi:hypothetical protein
VKECDSLRNHTLKPKVSKEPKAVVCRIRRFHEWCSIAASSDFTALSEIAVFAHDLSSHTPNQAAIRHQGEGAPQLLRHLHPRLRSMLLSRSNNTQSSVHNHPKQMNRDYASFAVGGEFDGVLLCEEPVLGEFGGEIARFGWVPGSS